MPVAKSLPVLKRKKETLLQDGYLQNCWIETFPLCTTHKRIRFIDKDGTQQKSPVHGNCFFYLGTNIGRFREVFGGIGVVTMAL